MNNQLFETISSYHSGQDSFLGTTTIIGMQKEEKINEDDKLHAMKTAFVDPFNELFELMEQAQDYGEVKFYLPPDLEQP